MPSWKVNRTRDEQKYAVTFRVTVKYKLKSFTNMSIHVPVLLDEVLAAIEPAVGETVVDGTLGGGGHTRFLAQAIGSGGRVIAIDQDPQAVAAVKSWNQHHQYCVQASLGNFADLPELLDAAGVDLVDGVVLDLGLSSDQLADETRGFSFESVGNLDLRFNPLLGEPAYRLLERLGEKHLADLIYQYGEERYSRRIARRIVETRRTDPVRTAQELRDLISRCVPSSAHRQRIHPATRTFQALRIAVNDELKNLEIGLKRIPERIPLWWQICDHKFSFARGSSRETCLSPRFSFRSRYQASSAAGHDRSRPKSSQSQCSTTCRTPDIKRVDSATGAVIDLALFRGDRLFL